MLMGEGNKNFLGSQPTLGLSYNSILEPDSSHLPWQSHSQVPITAMSSKSAWEWGSALSGP
jgi:hypothetical protein